MEEPARRNRGGVASQLGRCYVGRKSVEEVGRISATEQPATPPPSYSDAARNPILLESLKVRCNQTGPAAAILVIGVSVIVVVILRDAPLLGSLLWLGAVLVGMGWRLFITKNCRARLDGMTARELQNIDRTLRFSSIANQSIVGAGVWTLSAGSHDAELFITFIIMLYAVGAMINLASDYRSFRASLPLLLVQPVAYWAHDLDGLRVAVPLALLAPLMLLAVRQSAKTFADSVAIRLEKDELLEKMQAAHERTERALTIAEEANRSKAAFLAAASHDLRQPLFAISVLAETLLVHDLPKASREVLSRQLRAIAILRSLFDNLLDLAKFESGHVQAARTPMLLSEVLEPLNIEFGPLCEAKRLTWNFSCTNLPVLTDADLFRRQLGNLLSNAVRYTDKGEVSLLARPEGERVRITVADSGTGIPASDHERIFQEFVQLANPQRDRERGVGLGLAIVRRIDQLLGTGLTMESAVGSGTKFSLWVPLMEDAVLDATPSVTPSVGNALPGEFEVWLVEDDALVRSALGLQFGAWGCQWAAVTSRSALLELKAAQGTWPDAVILDDMLGPEDSGLDIARWLSHEMPDNRILIVTGNANAERIAELQASGLAFMRKPMASEELHRWLQSAANAMPEAIGESAAIQRD